jgi:GNAT superfamily N-acetyltransferase
VGFLEVEFKQELLHSCYDDAQELFKLHWDDVALNKDIIKLNPDYQSYEAAEKAEMLKIFTARSEGVLVGYFAALVQRGLHYKDHIFAQNDVLFLHKAHRKGMTGAKLIRFAENCLKDDGVSVLFINTKVHAPLDPLLNRLGFDHVENNFAKRLV